VSEQGAWKEWIGFFLQGVTEQATDAAARGHRLWELRESWRKDAINARRKALLPVLDSLFGAPVLTATTAAARLGLPYQGVLDSIKSLAEIGILKLGPRASYRQIYVAEEILRIVGEDDTTV